jgi:hypothetical protein
LAHSTVRGGTRTQRRRRGRRELCVSLDGKPGGEGEEGIVWVKAHSVCEAAIVVAGRFECFLAR